MSLLPLRNRPRGFITVFELLIVIAFVTGAVYFIMAGMKFISRTDANRQVEKMGINVGGNSPATEGKGQ